MHQPAAMLAQQSGTTHRDAAYRVSEKKRMLKNFDEIVAGVLQLVDQHTTDPNMQAPSQAWVSAERAPASASKARGRSSEALRSPSKEDWKLIEEAALLPEAVLIET
jgi:hypothetical protein